MGFKDDSKARAQRSHAKRRCRERYEIILNKYTYRQLVAMIQNNKARFLERQSRRVTIWSIPYEGKNLIAVYDAQRQTIASFLPRDADFHPNGDQPLAENRYQEKEIEKEIETGYLENGE